MYYTTDRTVLTAFDWKPYQGLEPRQAYRVVRSFTDYDGDTDAVGLELTYRAYSYVPCHQGLTLAFDSEHGQLLLRLEDHPESRGAIIAALREYFERIEGQ